MIIAVFVTLSAKKKEKRNDSQKIEKREKMPFLYVLRKKIKVYGEKDFFYLKKAVKEEWTGGKSAMCAKKLKSAAVTKMFF